MIRLSAVRATTLTIALWSVSLIAGCSQPQKDLRAGFVNPPASARPMTWWHWMGGNISRDGITADLQSMKRVGLQGAMIFHVGQLPFNGDVEFMSPQWWDLMRFAADEAARLDLKLGVHNCPGWSESGGPWITPEQSMQKVVWFTTAIDGSGHREVTLAQPQVDGRWNYYRDIAVIAIPDRAGPVDHDSVIDVSSHMNDEGKLTWDAPAGRWRIYRFGHTTTGSTNHPAPQGAEGLEVDKFNPAAVEAHFKAYPERILANCSPAGRKAFTMLTIDSYEAGEQNWSPVFREEFWRRRGYDPVPWLPVLAGAVIGSDDVAARFKRDMERTVADLFHDNYFAEMGKLVHQHPGVQFCAEPYGGAFNTITAGGEADLVMGEFWQDGEMQVDAVVSSAHVHGRKVVGAEAFTAEPQKDQWRLDPYALKPTGDAAFAAGVNMMVLHTFAHQPWMNALPGFTMGWWGTHFGRTQTWWNQSPPFFDYLARCQYLLQQGVTVVDVLSLGSAAVPVVGPEPISTGSLTDYPAADSAVKQIGAEVWGDRDRAKVKKHEFGKGRVFSGVDLAAVLGQQKLDPDVSFPSGSWPLAWTHRRTDDADIYFLANQRRATVTTQVSLRAGGAVPELWDPETGKMSPATVWSSQEGRTNVFLRLGPAQSTFVVIPRRAATPADHVVEVLLDGQSITAPDRRGEGLVIREARYGIIDDPKRSIDVTDAVRERLSAGGILSGTNELAGRDPALNVVKSIRVVYELRGQQFDKTFAENEPIEFDAEPTRATLPPAELIAASHGQRSLIVYKPGTFDIRFASGQSKEVKIDRVPQEITVTGPWHLRFPPDLGAPPSIELTELASWTLNSDPGVRYFSGTAEYRTTFNVPSIAKDAGNVALLDLGDVRNIAEVELNGQSLGILWKPPFRVEVAGKLRSGVNTLIVRVTNLWPNRLIGDEQQPNDLQWGKAWDNNTRGGQPLAEAPAWAHDPTTRPSKGRVTLTTWKFYDKDSALLDSGLLGPVKIVSGVKQDVR